MKSSQFETSFRTSTMKKSLSRMLGVSAVALGAFLSYGDDRPARAAVEHAIEVKHVAGSAEYAYDSTGWRPLRAGKVLHAGASVRTAAGGMVLLAMEEEGALVRVGPSSRLELAKAAPATELGMATTAPLQANVEPMVPSHSESHVLKRIAGFSPMALVSREVFWTGN
jgi:hypothetical protein